MPRSYLIYQVDAFTRDVLAGNPAGVVPHAEGLSDTEMQRIARELNNSETAFLLPPDGDDHDVRVRYFTPTQEVPTCGHATIAAHYLRAKLEGPPEGGRVLSKIGIGILPVDVEERDGDYHVTMTQGEVRIGDPLEGEARSGLLRALGLEEDDLLEGCPLQFVGTGNPKIIVAVCDVPTLNAMAPDMNALLALRDVLEAPGIFVFAFDPEGEPGGEGPLTRARMFAPAIGINEDPVTGNGNGPLGAYLAHHGLVLFEGNTLRFKGLQGEAMGRPGVAHVTIVMENGRPQTVRVGGDAVIAFQAELSL